MGGAITRMSMTPTQATLRSERGMHAQWWLRGIGLGFGGLIVLCTAVDVDLALSAWFYTPDVGWRDAAAWRWLYDFGPIPALVMSLGALAILIGSRWRPAWVGYRRTCCILVLAVLLGPGLAVNGLIKPLWGRPRPRHVAMFGGANAYRPWWQPYGIGRGSSFPSGHASMGFVMIARAVWVPRSKRGLRRWAIGGAIGYGVLMSCGRIAQGGHFFSDVLWSGLIAVLISDVLCRMLSSDVIGHALPASDRSPPGGVR